MTQTEIYTMFLDWKNQYCQKTILPKAIYRFKAMSMKLPMTFFLKKLEQKNIKILYKRPQTAKAMLRKKNGAGRIGLPDFRLYFKVILIKTVQYWHKNRNIDQWKKESLK